MNHPVVDEPRQNLLDAPDRRVAGAEAQGQRVVLPVWRGIGGGIGASQRGVAFDLDAEAGHLAGLHDEHRVGGVATSQSFGTGD